MKRQLSFEKQILKNFLNPGCSIHWFRYYHLPCCYKSSSQLKGVFNPNFRPFTFEFWSRF